MGYSKRLKQNYGDKILFLIRSVPGAGKSTLAYTLSTNVCEADEYHTLESGEYDWKPENVRKSHIWCQNRCEKFMRENKSPIVVSNTTTTEKEVKPYMDLALKYGYKVVSLIVENRHGSRNIHNVPEDIIKKMKDRFSIKL